MPNRRGKMDVMTALSLAKKMRAQNREMGDPMDRSEMEGFRPVPGMTTRGYMGSERGPAYEPVYKDRMKRIESSAAFPESDPMTGMTDSEAFPESERMADASYLDRMKDRGRQLAAMTPSDSMGMMNEALDSMPFNRGRQFDRMSVQPGGRLPAMRPSDSMGMMTGMTDSEAFPESDPYPKRYEPIEFDPEAYKLSPEAYKLREFKRAPLKREKVKVQFPSEFMEELVSSTDFGNAYADTLATRTPDMFDSVEDLQNVPMMYDAAVEKAFSLYARTGEVPPAVSIEVGRLSGLMDVKKGMEDLDAEALRQSMMDERVKFKTGREVQPAIENFGDSDAR